MKELVAYKFMASLLGIEDATALFSSVLGNLDREGCEIYDCERTFTGINVCPHCIYDVFRVTPNRNNKNS